VSGQDRSSNKWASGSSTTIGKTPDIAHVLEVEEGGMARELRGQRLGQSGLAYLTRSK
jgi:hypothetical protein